MLTQTRLFSLLSRSSSSSFYDLSIPERVASGFRTFVVSTPQTAELCGNPFVAGISYRKALQVAAEQAFLQPFFVDLFRGVKNRQLNVLHFLRGGLSYQLAEALQAAGFSSPNCSFMTSERVESAVPLAGNSSGWQIHKDQYVELTLGPETLLFIGDIVASGSTLRTGLAKIKEKLVENSGKEDSPTLRHVCLFTIGGEPAEEILWEYHQLFRRLFADYSGTTVVYIEGLFHTADSRSPRFNPDIGTDLVPSASRNRLSFEFASDLEKDPLKGLEQCMVYDGGSRAFFPVKYYHSLAEYSLKVKQKLDAGLSAFDLVADRWDGVLDLDESVQQRLRDPKTGYDWVSKRLSDVEQKLSE